MKKSYSKKLLFFSLALFFYGGTFVKAQGPTNCTDLPNPGGPCTVIQNFNGGNGSFTSTASSGPAFTHNPGTDGDMRVTTSASTVYTLTSPAYSLNTDNVAFIGFRLEGLSGIAPGSTMRLAVLNNAGTELAFCVVNAYIERVCVRFDDTDLDPGTMVNYRVTFNTVSNPGTNGGSLIIDDFSIGAAGAALPVTLESFHGRRNNTTVTLNWETVSESNARGFHIQRKSGNTPFENIGFVESRAVNGNSNTRLRYGFSDLNNNSSGAVEYRIIAADLDGRSRYSIIRSVDGLKGKAKILIYPNPSANKPVNIVFPNNDTRSILLTDLMGKVHTSWKSYTKQDLKLNKLTPGNYVLRITDVATSKSEIYRITISE